MMPNQPIETERLILRPVENTDLQGMFELDSDPEVHKYLGNMPIKTLDQAQEGIDYLQKQYKERGIARWAVVLKETNEFMGWCGIKYLIESEQMNGVYNVYELGYRFIPKFWGKGYATESAQAWVDYMFKEAGVKSLYAAADIPNKGSVNVLQKVGFKITDEFVFEWKGVKSNCYWLEQHQ
ncbi:GNAT family N-acetyltransferase [Pseudofulvibacter geojedonensis]|uniref:GNAT family N-acetyltransferase n=1 Tax=Pseudofulvibacter geojedonensis TaxID=1123758 RepID=A0ABW3I1F4_9FLAO